MKKHEELRKNNKKTSKISSTYTKILENRKKMSEIILKKLKAIAKTIT